MKRLRVAIADLAGWQNLQLALWKAARSKRNRRDVIEYLRNGEDNLLNLQRDILNGTLALKRYRQFMISDPKPRKIIAVDFELRVLHHAIMNLIGTSLERSQIDNSFACLPGRGVHRAICKVQRGTRRAHWYVQIDIEKYFENIDHALLKKKLRRRFKGQEFIELLDCIIDSYQDAPGKGLPIGSLTSQYFANFYLERVDRMIQGFTGVSGYIRYMDDMVWFCHDREVSRKSLAKAIEEIGAEHLLVKSNRTIQPVSHGVSFCGYRVLPHRILLSTRKKRSYRDGLGKWQMKYTNGEISSLNLQRAYDAVHGVTTGADSLELRKKMLAQMEICDA